MKDRIIYFASAIGLLIIMVFAVSTVILTVNDGFKTVANNEAFVSAFAGAFFTFILVKFAELGTRLRNVEKDNLQGLVAINHTLMGHMNQISNADFVAKDIIATYEKTTSATEPIAINFNFFKSIPFEPETLKVIRNTKFLNEVYSYYADTEKLNDSMMALQKFIDAITNGLIGGNLSRTDYLQNAPLLSEKTKELRKFIKHSLKEAERLTALDRLLLKHRSVLWRLAVNIRTFDEYSKKVNEDFESEMNVIKQEIAETSAKSRAEIESIVKEK